MSSISAIFTSYMRPWHLRRCLISLEVQTRPPDEVVITDDGSDEAHREAVREIMRACTMDVRYVRQENGDVAMFPDAVAQHEALSERRFWTPGNAVRLDANDSAKLDEACIWEGKLNELWPPPEDPRVAKLARMEAKFRGRSQDRWLRLFEGRMRKLRLITIQCGVPRSAFERVNGFDERYVRPLGDRCGARLPSVPRAGGAPRPGGGGAAPQRQRCLLRAATLVALPLSRRAASPLIRFAPLGASR